MPQQYFIIYKPYGVLSQFSPTPGKATLKDFFKVATDVYPVGRLDSDSEGLLILTNDKTLNHRLLNPAFAHEREYWVQVEGEIGETALQQLRKGVSISLDGKSHQTLSSKAEKFETTPDLPPRNPPIRYRKSIPDSWIRLSLKEGKNRQVRKMTAIVGFPTLRLVRYSIGGINISGMKPGDFKEMDRPSVYGLLFGK
jgi:23S rRNA pseudouridine2457 synthase